MRKSLLFAVLAGLVLGLSACVVPPPQPQPRPQFEPQARPEPRPEPRPPHAGKLNPNEIQNEIANQQQRINQGIASGALTQSEAQVVQDNLNWIKHEFGRLKNQGAIAPEQLKGLHQMLEKNSRIIYDAKHNPAVRLY